MIGALPHFELGMSWKDVKAREMNTLVAEVQRLRTIIGGTGVNVNSTPQGTSITATTKPPITKPRELIVSLIEEPTDESQTLLVRQVQYASLPPAAGVYEWDANHFEAYPAQGFECLDYGSYYCNPTTDAPAGDALFLRAERRQNVWMLYPPPAMAAIANVVVIRAIPEGGEYGTVLQVQRVTLTDGGQWAATGETFEMPTFPLIPAIVYRLAILAEGEPQQMGDILPTCSVAGVEVVELFFPMVPTVVRSDEPHRGCRPRVL